MLAVLHAAHALKKARGGRPNKLSVENTLMAAPECLREYRAYFHIGGNYGISESYAYKLIRRAEDALIKSGEFPLPGKKELLKSGAEYEVVLIDAAETPAERPKRGKSSGIRERKSGARSKRRQQRTRKAGGLSVPRLPAGNGMASGCLRNRRCGL